VNAVRVQPALDRALSGAGRTKQSAESMAKRAPLPPNSVHAESRRAWRAWLQKHHAIELGVWLITWKKASGRPVLAYGDLVEEALCFGWIDSRPNKLDDERSMRWFAPRKAHSGWSALNKARAGRAQAAGLMTPAGQARIDAAMADGSWLALDAVDALEIPADLALVLKARELAFDNFTGFPRSAKRSILEWIGNAKTAPTRIRRIEETARLAAAGERANQWRR
jgi:uncharacterized protein YdeI (YjbR/CyaY-like superfamily)